MKRHLVKRTPLLCAAWREDDGLAPRFEARRRVKSSARKDLQLAKQAQLALSLFLEGECQHPDLLDVAVLAVRYEPAQQRLCVEIGSCCRETDGDAVLAALNQRQALLRSVLAGCLQRKKVPLLGFYYVGNRRAGEGPCRSKP